jgi:hypothetical protein
MNNFFSLFAKNVRSILAILVNVAGFSFLFCLLIYKIPPGNETILNVAAGIILAVVGGVDNYYFGSSKDKSDVDKSDSEIEKKKAGIDPPVQ